MTPEIILPYKVLIAVAFVVERFRTSTPCEGVFFVRSLKGSLQTFDCPVYIPPHILHHPDRNVTVPDHGGAPTAIAPGVHNERIEKTPTSRRILNTFLARNSKERACFDTCHVAFFHCFKKESLCVSFEPRRIENSFPNLVCLAFVGHVPPLNQCLLPKVRDDANYV